MLPIAPEYQTHVEIRPIVIEVKREYKDIQFFTSRHEARAYQKTYGGYLVQDQVQAGRWILIFIPKG